MTDLCPFIALSSETAEYVSSSTTIASNGLESSTATSVPATSSDSGQNRSTTINPAGTSVSTSTGRRSRTRATGSPAGIKVAPLVQWTPENISKRIERCIRGQKLIMNDGLQLAGCQTPGPIMDPSFSIFILQTIRIITRTITTAPGTSNPRPERTKRVFLLSTPSRRNSVPTL